ncbi:MAG: penicillin-binding transpeptidase domain-containing protein [Oscillospiraceae bacterium]|nr:penicillin-binding transpeptidase domain-containing protein [Oscillospiraceae bacterium]
MSGGIKTGPGKKRKSKTAADYKTRRAISAGYVTGMKTGQKKEKQRISKALLVRTLFLLTVCGVAAFVILAVRLYDVQIINSSYYESRTLDGQLRESTIRASRGTIYDANNKILAMSGPVENVFISPLELSMHDQDVRFIAEGLSYILNTDFADFIEKAGRTNSQYQVIKSKVESEEAEKVRDFIKEHSLRGIHFEPASQRYYPNDTLASQVLGFVGTDNIGLDGIEQRFDSALTGVSGRIIRMTNAKGNDLMLAGFGDLLQAKDGNNIKLTLNMSVQYYVEKHLSQAIIDYNILGGAMCIAMNPNTGEILAMANYPTFDPNNFLKLSQKDSDRIDAIEDEEERAEAHRLAQFRQWRNQSLADSYEPGSVFKIITFAMALEENAANPESMFYCDGSIDVKLFDDVSERKCWRRWGHGYQTLNAAMSNSCNIACVELGLKVGSRTFYKYIDAFGMFDKTGLDNSIEGRSLWWDSNVFYDRNNQTQLASASFGQTFKITPIQMITAAAATVNGGYLMQPHMVKQITDSNGNILEATEPTVLRQVVSSETSALMRVMLEDVVNKGTGINAQVRGYRIGGKTGTSESIEQLAQRDEDDTSNKDYVVSFLGFAPADDPEIMVLLLMDTPSHDTGIYISGGSIAAPVVGKMLEDILPMSLGIMPQYTDEDLADINLHVPRVAGWSVPEAIAILEEQGYGYTIVGDGNIVTAQLPARNAFVASGTKVVIYADAEVPVTPVTVPNLSGMTYSKARQALESIGLFIRTGGAPKTDKNALVSVQSIEPGREVQYGSIVEITLINANVVE